MMNVLSSVSVVVSSSKRSRPLRENCPKTMRKKRRRRGQSFMTTDCSRIMNSLKEIPRKNILFHFLPLFLKVWKSPEGRNTAAKDRRCRCVVKDRTAKYESSERISADSQTTFARRRRPLATTGARTATSRRRWGSSKRSAKAAASAISRLNPNNSEAILVRRRSNTWKCITFAQMRKSERWPRSRWRRGSWTWPPPDPLQLRGPKRPLPRWPRPQLQRPPRPTTSTISSSIMTTWKSLFWIWEKILRTKPPLTSMEKNILAFVPPSQNAICSGTGLCPAERPFKSVRPDRRVSPVGAAEPTVIGKPITRIWANVSLIGFADWTRNKKKTPSNA